MDSNFPSFEPCKSEEPYIFVSYSRKDKDVVIKDLNMLGKSGFRIWYDKEISAGEKWEKYIEEHITNCNCKVFLIFASSKSLHIESENVRHELSIAKLGRNQEKLTIFPVFVDEDIDESNRAFNFLNSLNGIVRPKEPSIEYYKELQWRLEEASVEIRNDPRDRDSIRLGLGYLPTIKDVFSEHNLPQAMFEERRKEYVLKMGDSESTHKIDNIFQLTSDKTQALQKLGDVLVKSTTEKPCNLISLPLDIGETYIAPLRLINGLITRLDENWPPLVNSYGRLVKQNKSDLLDDLHYFIEFCWLAWGPSVLTTLDLDEEVFVVLQVAYGDEANSLPLIMKRTLLKSIISRLPETPNNISGWPVTIKNVILVKPGIDEYFSDVKNYPLFKDMFSGEDKVALYLPDGNDGYACGDIKRLIKNTAQEGSNEPGSFYSTAYVWLMLEQVDKAEFKKGYVVKNNKLEPGKVLPFFEHANLATKKGLNFLQHCLARKAIYHVLECEADDDYQEEGYYCFATALFPEQMLDILKKEKEKLSQAQQKILDSRLIISDTPKQWRTHLEVVEFADALNQAIKDSLLNKVN